MLFQRDDHSGERGKCEKNQALLYTLMFIYQNYTTSLWFVHFC